MNLKEGMLLFHGSYTPVEKIDLGMCANAKDFGKGFYLTSDLQQAKGFVKSSVIKAQRHHLAAADQDFGFISSFRFHFHRDDLRIHTFQEADRDWLWFIAKNRRGVMFAKSSLNINDISQSDIIVGKVANDQTNPVITAYLNGLYGDVMSDEAVQYATGRLMPEHLVDQYCFLTEKAIQCLEFQEARKYAG